MSDVVTGREASLRPHGGPAFIALAALLALGYGFFFGFLVVGDAGFSSTEMVHSLGALAFSGVLLTGLGTQLLAPARQLSGFWQVFAGILGGIFAAAIVGDPNNRGGQAGVFDWTYLIFLVPLPLLLALHPARRDLFRPGKPSVVLLLLVLVAAIPLALYGIDQALTQRNSWPPKSDPHHNAHWLAMANLAFAAPLVGLLAALRLPGWRVAAGSAAGMVAVLGLSSVLFPDAASSVGLVWGLAALAGAGAFLVVATVTGRSDTAGGGVSP